MSRASPRKNKTIQLKNNEWGKRSPKVKTPNPPVSPPSKNVSYSPVKRNNVTGQGGGGETNKQLNMGSNSMPDPALLRNIFVGMDSDLDGIIDVGEFYLSLKGTSMEDQALTLFNQMDKNRDGSVSMYELIKHLYPFAGDEDVEDLLVWVRSGGSGDSKKKGETNAEQNGFWSDGEQDNEIRSMFRSFDKNGDGKLTVRELAGTMSEIHHVDKKDVEKMFTDLGKTKRDIIEEEEFAVMFHQFIDGNMELGHGTHKVGHQHGSSGEKGTKDNEASRMFSVRKLKNLNSMT